MHSVQRATLTAVFPNYNHAAFLAQALDGYVNQARRPDELIVLDDASSDASVEIIESYVRRHSFIRLIRHERNTGVILAMGELLAAATGDYVYFGAADDFILPPFFEQAMAAVEAHPEAGIVFGKMIAVDRHGKKLRDVQAPAWQTTQYVSPDRYRREYLDRQPPYRSLSASTIYRRACLTEVGGFSSQLGHWCDTFAIRAIALKYGAVYVPTTFTAWRKLPESFSHAARQNLAKNQSFIDGAAAMMRSEAFRDRFPEDHVASWQRKHRMANRLLYARELLRRAVRWSA